MAEDVYGRRRLLLIMFISYVDRVNISVAAVAMQDGWSESRKGLDLSSFFVGYMLMQVVGGWFAKVTGGRRILITSLVLCSVCLLLIAVRISLGLTEAPINPSVYNIFSRWVPLSERARSVELYSSAGFLGTFMALALTGPVVERFGRESPFYIFGLFGIAYALLLWIAFPAAPQNPEGPADPESGNPESSNRPARSSVP